MTDIGDEDEKPLDPAIENIRRRMLRLLFVSIGILMAGILAVFGAIVYKINDRGDDTQSASRPDVIPGGNDEQQKNRSGKRKFLADIQVDIPDGSNVISTRLRRGWLILELESVDGSRQVWLVDMVSGNVESRVVIQ